MLSRRFLLAAVAGAFSLVAWAEVPRAATRDAAETFIRGLTNEAISMAAPNQTLDQKRQRFRELLHRSFDLTEISRFILGRYWRSASPQQQQEFLRLFEDLTVLTWSKRFDEYNGQQMQVVNVGAESEQGMLIETSVDRVAGPPLPVFWRVRDTAGNLKVIDIVVEGVSMAITHRSEYTSAIQGTGGLDGLLDAMRKKIVVLQGG